MSKERLKITQPLCVTAKFMLDKGGTVTETAQLLGISQSTLSRIQAADFDAEKYATQLEARRAEDQRKREEQKQAEDQDSVALFFWDGESKGTKHCIESAKKRGIPARIWNTKTGKYMEGEENNEHNHNDPD